MVDDGINDRTNPANLALLTPGCLREAIFLANQTAAQDTITFNIGNGEQEIELKTAALPPIINPLILDGATQNGRQNQSIVITRDGTVPGTASGLVFGSGVNLLNQPGTGAHSTVLSLAIYGFGEAGILIQNVNDVGINKVLLYLNKNGLHISGPNATNNSVTGSRLGVYQETIVGATTGNSNAGVLIDNGAHDNHIGGPGQDAINTISGNRNPLPNQFSAGVRITNANNNHVFGNYIGLKPDGLSASFGQQTYGVHITGTSAGNYIGGQVELGGAPGSLNGVPC